MKIQTIRASMIRLIASCLAIILSLSALQTLGQGEVQPKADGDITTVQTQIPDALRGESAAAVGPYTAIAVPFSFDDISGTGTVAIASGDDVAVTINPVGFSFPFYGITRTSVGVSSNGLLTFGGTDSTFTNSDLTSGPNFAAIAPYWDDLFITNSTNTARVYFQMLGAGPTQRLVIQWNVVQYFSGGPAGDNITFQAQLFADGRILFNYQDLVSGASANNNGAAATVGIKAAGPQGPDRLLLAFNNGPNAFVGTGLSTLIFPVGSVDLFGVTAANQLLKINKTTPSSVTTVGVITGLGAGESILGIDVRPATGELYGLGITDNGATRSGRIYKIDPTTAVATQVGAGSFSTTLGDTDFWGFNFNPRVDRIRVTNRNGQNLRVNPDNGVLAGTDTNLSVAGINGIAYDRSDGGSPTTTLYALNFDQDTFGTIGGIDGAPSPNGGAFTLIGQTGIIAQNAYGFDIELGTDIGRVTASLSGTERLFTINLATGALTQVGAIAGNPTLRGITHAASNTRTTVQPVITPATYGDTVQLTASLTSSLGTPQGTVSFFDGEVAIAGCGALPLNAAGSVTCSTNALPAGARTIRASYSGLGLFEPSTGTTVQTVNKKTLNITASSHTVTYGDAAPAVTSTITGFITGEGTGNLTTQPNCSTTYTQGSGVAGSPYPTSCSGGVAANYQFNYINGTVLVNKKALSLTADNKSRGYGAANPALTFTPSGFIAGDNLGNSTTGSPGLSTTATATSPVGTYPITITLGTLASANYSFSTLTNGTLTVTGVQLTVTADNKSRVFGAPNPPLTFTVTGFVNGEGVGVLSGSPAISTTANATSAPGTYPITVTQGTLANPNYTFAFVNGTLTVTIASTTTVITNAASLAANATTPGQSYAVNWSVSPVAPATGTPTGNVSVSDGTGATCSAAVAAGTCSLTSTTVGVKTITATYSGDANFTGSASAPVQHNVAIGITGNVKQFIAFGTNTNLAGVTLTLLNTGTNQATTTTTDANGNYSFGVITLGQNYTITPSGLGKAYEATTRTYSNVNTNISGADFLAYDVPGPNAIPRTARVVSQTATPGTPVTIPVLMTTTGVESRVAFTVQFAVGTLGIPTVACGTGAAGCNLSVDVFSPGKVGITIVPTAPLAAGTVQVARITFPTFPTNLTGTPVTFGDFPTARSVRNAENNPLPVLYWTDGQVAFTGGTLLEGGSIAGRVLTPSGQGLRNATVTLIDPNGNRWTATTGSFGNYQFENLELGRDYMVTVNSRRFRFATRTINLASNLTGVDMIGLE
jgi:hypothetical protein